MSLTLSITIEEGEAEEEGMVVIIQQSGVPGRSLKSREERSKNNEGWWVWAADAHRRKGTWSKEYRLAPPGSQVYFRAQTFDRVAWQTLLRGEF